MPDTEAARADMRIARKYIEDYHSSQSPNLYNLEFAMKYIERARQKDTNVTLKAKGIDTDVFDWTPNKMQAEVLALQGIAIFNESVSGREIQRDDLGHAISLLKHSIDLMPMPTPYTTLATAYNLIDRRPQADAILREAAQRFPNDFSVQKSIDFMEASPNTGVRPTNYSSIFFLLGCFFAIIAFCGFLYQASAPEPPPNSPADFLIFAAYISIFGIIGPFLTSFFTRPK